MSFRDETTTSEPEEECDKPGIMCASCKKSVYCIDYGGKYQNITMDTCDDTTNCYQGYCTNETNIPCVQGKKSEFICNDIGMFPNPYDCKAYHVCSKTGVSAPQISCPAKYAYDPITTYCKISIPNGCPTNPPVPYCLKIGQSGPLVNKSIFYICIAKENVLIPQLFICPYGKTYLNNKCT